MDANFERYIEVETELRQTETDIREAEIFVNAGRMSAAVFHQFARGIHEQRARLMDEREALLS
jgi:hypothetical protein